MQDYECNDGILELKSMPVKYQGDDITLYIKFKDKDTGVYKSLSMFSDVIVYAYTNYQSLVVKGSYVQKTGYVSLNVIDEYTYEFIIDSSYTVRMDPGALQMEINFVKSSTNSDILDGKYNIIAKSPAIMSISKSNIKVESNTIA